MKFRFEHGLIWIAADLIYEKKVIKIENCILDTGSASTAFDIDSVELNYNKQSVIKRLFGVGKGSQEVICQEVDGLVIGGVEANNIYVEFGDLKTKLMINGFIGNDFLRQFTVMIDYSRNEIQLSPMI